MSSAQVQSARLTAFERQCGNCFYCGVAMWVTTPFELPGCKSVSSGYARLRCTAEHLVARSEGGRDCSANIVAACLHCNATRHRRKRPPEPGTYREEIARRVARGAWHPRWVHERRLIQQSSDCVLE